MAVDAWNMAAECARAIGASKYAGLTIYNFAKIIARDGGHLGAIEHRALGPLG
jgi:hypothetical protein